jgi:hypothetical protein
MYDDNANTNLIDFRTTNFWRTTTWVRTRRPSSSTRSVN